VRCESLVSDRPRVWPAAPHPVAAGKRILQGWERWQRVSPSPFCASWIRRLRMLHVTEAIHAPRSSETFATRRGPLPFFHHDEFPKPSGTVPILLAEASTTVHRWENGDCPLLPDAFRTGSKLGPSRIVQNSKIKNTDIAEDVVQRGLDFNGQLKTCHPRRNVLPSGQFDVFVTANLSRSTALKWPQGDDCRAVEYIFDEGNVNATTDQQSRARVVGLHHAG
jgi:hypothetical protein